MQLEGLPRTDFARDESRSQTQEVQLNLFSQSLCCGPVEHTMFKSRYLVCAGTWQGRSDTSSYRRGNEGTWMLNGLPKVTYKIVGSSGFLTFKPIFLTFQPCILFFFLFINTHTKNPTKITKPVALLASMTRPPGSSERAQGLVGL